MHSAHQSFANIGIAPKLLDILERLSFHVPTPIQRQAIPVAIEGKDVVGIAQTGTGKTLAFAVPLLQRLAGMAQSRGLILVPTRELALQVHEAVRELGKSFGLRTAVLIGGLPLGPQVRDLQRAPHIIIATPGRLVDHLERRNIKLQQVHILVLDEADRMFDMGFAPQLAIIFRHLPKERQTMLFSATMPPQIATLAARTMRSPIRIEVAPSGTVVAEVEQEMFLVAHGDKIRLLDKLLTEYRGSVLVFSRTKHGAKRITRSIRAMGHAAAELHGNRSLSQRRQALEGFKSGMFRVLVATDLAARGIHVTGIELVINYDLPGSPEDYVHRIGRTARAGHAGKAISFATHDQGNDIRQIERLVKTRLMVRKEQALPPHRAPQVAAPERRGSEPGRTTEHRRVQRRTGSNRGRSSHRRGRSRRGRGQSPRASGVPQRAPWTQSAGKRV